MLLKIILLKQAAFGSSSSLHSVFVPILCSPEIPYEKNAINDTFFPSSAVFISIVLFFFSNL